jgi:aryl-alcohol dehydrogenase-like predicted oxidoreductase
MEHRTVEVTWCCTVRACMAPCVNKLDRPFQANIIELCLTEQLPPIIVSIHAAGMNKLKINKEKKVQWVSGRSALRERLDK